MDIRETSFDDAVESCAYYTPQPDWCGGGSCFQPESERWPEAPTIIGNGLDNVRLDGEGDHD